MFGCLLGSSRIGLLRVSLSLFSRLSLIELSLDFGATRGAFWARPPLVSAFAAVRLDEPESRLQARTGAGI